MDRERAAVLGGFGGPTAVIVVLLLLGVGDRRSTEQPGGRAVAPPIASPPAASSDAGAFRGGRNLLEAFFGARLESLDSLCPPARGGRPATARLGSGVHCPAADRPSAFRIIVASVPDPFDSYLDWAYDGDIEAIRRAFAAAGYVAHAHSLPGRRDSITVNGQRVRRFDHEPGVMLFRLATPDTIGLVLLYLIPELPSSGLHRHAVRTALRERRAILDCAGRGLGASQRERDELVVVGPMFSGSAQSLRMLLDEELQRPGDDGSRAARVITGSATSASNRLLLTDAKRVGVAPRPLPRSIRDTQDSVPRIAFMAALNTDAGLQGALDSFMGTLGLASHEVVVLTESGTEYGLARAADGPTGPLVISFPASVAALRGEFGQRLAEQQRAASMAGLDAMARSGITLGDSLRSRERPPIISPLTYSASDVALSALIRAVSEHNIRLVVIHATDVRDKLWLADEVRRRVRDVVVATFEANALLLRPEFAGAFRGGIVVSSYPLLPENQFWTASYRDRAGERVVRLRNLAGFTSDDAFGVYNATLEAMDAGAMLRSAFHSHGMRPGQTYNRPPIWTSVIGRGSMYPIVATLPDSIHRAYFGALTEREFTPRDTADAVGRPHEHGYSVLRTGVREAFVLPAIAVLLIALSSLLRQPAIAHRWLPAQGDLAFPRSARQSLLLGGLICVLATMTLPVVATILGADHALNAVDAGDVGERSLWWIIVLAATALSLLLALLYMVAGLAGIFLEMLTRGRDWLGGRDDASAKGAAVVLRALGIDQLDGTLGVAPLFAATPIGDSDEVADGTDREASIDRARRAEEAIVRRPFTEREPAIPVLVAAVAIAVIVAVFSLANVTFALGIAGLVEHGGLTATLFVFRALHISSGVSPLVPLLMLSVAFALWLWWLLRLVRSMEEGDRLQDALVGLANSGRSDAGLWRLANGLVSTRRALQWLVPHNRTFLLVLFALAMVTIIGWGGWMASIERITFGSRAWASLAFEVALAIGLLSLPAGVALAVARLLRGWAALRRFLDECAATPLKDAILRLPPHLTRVTQVGLVGERPAVERLGALEDEYWIAAMRALEPLRPTKASNAPPTDVKAAKVAEVCVEDAASAGSDRSTELTHADVVSRDALVALCTQEAKSAGAERLTQNLLALHGAWSAGAARYRPGSDAKHVKVKDALDRAEEFAALHVVRAVDPILRHLHRVSVFLLLTLLACIILTSTYPFHPESLFAVVSVLLLLATVGSILWVMLEMNRDAFLSAMSRTPAGQVSWDSKFITNLLTVGVLPILTFASSQFPSLRTSLFSWADPLLRLITKN